MTKGEELPAAKRREIQARDIRVGDVIDTRRGNQGRVTGVRGHVKEGILSVTLDNFDYEIDFYEGTPVDLLRREREPDGGAGTEEGATENDEREASPFSWLMDLLRRHR